jgi:hypothetical protein
VTARRTALSDACARLRTTEMISPYDMVRGRGVGSPVRGTAAAKVLLGTHGTQDGRRRGRFRIAGVLTRILVPPTNAKQDEQARQAAIAQLAPRDRLVQLAAPAANPAPAASPTPARTALSSIASSDWRLAILGGLFVVCGGLGLWFLNAPYEGSTQPFAVAGASGATALGILVPDPKLKSSG